jgi:hypothetical protein
MDWADLGIKLLEMLLPIIGTLITALLGLGVAYLSKEIQKVKIGVAREALDEALAELYRVASDAIKYVNQVYVDDIKKAREDGKLTEEERREAMNKAKMYFIKQLPANIESVLEKALGPIELWLEDFLEARVGEEKK